MPILASGVPVLSSHSNRIVLALGMLFLIVLALPLATGWDPILVAVENRLLAPDRTHLLGTDDLGRDVLSRVLHGAKLTVSVSILALLTSLGIGTVLGACAGYFYTRWPDNLFGWLADFIIAVPFVVLIAAILTLIGPGVEKAYMVLVGIIWVAPARIVRAEVIKTMQMEFVLAERAIGTAEWKIVFVSVLPTCVESAVIFAAGYLPEIIALEAGLSFLGLGVQPPDPGLGKMIFDGINYMTSAWWLALSPAVMLFLLILTMQGIVWILTYNGTGGKNAHLSLLSTEDS